VDVWGMWMFVHGYGCLGFGVCGCLCMGGYVAWEGMWMLVHGRVCGCWCMGGYVDVYAGEGMWMFVQERICGCWCRGGYVDVCAGEGMYMFVHGIGGVWVWMFVHGRCVGVDELQEVVCLCMGDVGMMVCGCVS
jgi:hypothetical protein